MVLLRNVPLRRLPIVTNLFENGKEVRRPKIFISGIAVLVGLVSILIHVPLAVRNVMSVLPAHVIRPMRFASISCMCVKLVKLITIRGTILGRGDEELSESILLLELLLVEG